ncbi:PilZ domain-containing protein [uncultured Erythrobacter sp.]|uniref:PilZ domain-containing protein n=1 Tax=uncultured Erythrobacter sp. TaxID=263913 RepID=UPI00260C1ED2|nr:PilZ domain-containing protein [uncultured Erythrobacter sp.]
MRARKDQRKIISIPGRYFTGLGDPVDVELKNLSVRGCCMAAVSGKLPPGSRLQIHIGSSGPHHAHVKWARDNEVGVVFVKPLDPERFARFQSSHVPDSAQSTIAGDFEDMLSGRPQRFC